MSISPDIVHSRDRILEEIQDRVLWLSVYMVDYANRIRQNPSGLKVGGHQSSSASVATVMTYLFFEYMRSTDRISIKPHASPVYHAIQFLLGNLDRGYLKTLRAFHGLQAYPSRTKDPDHVDFSTGSVGLGAVAPNFASLVGEYISTHFTNNQHTKGKNISLVGDAELDEGSVWEAIAEPALIDIKNVLWIVDLNRQSLDRIIPGIRVQVWREMFQANGWHVVDAKYGKYLQSAFEEPGGDLLKQSIDDMPNEMYQRLLRVNSATLRDWLPRLSEHPKDLEKIIGRWDDDELQRLIRNLGGHDFGMLREAFGEIENEEGPSVLFAYTLKGWRLPSIGDPQNHSVNLNEEQMEKLRVELRIEEEDMESGFRMDTAAGIACREASSRLRTESQPVSPPDIEIPDSFNRSYGGNMSTQQIYGLVLTEISRSLPELAQRVVTISPDVASSTNLGGWINRVGIWTESEREPMPEEDIVRALQWVESPNGQHIELGISENNLFIALGQLGLSHEMHGELLFPVGTLYDPFIRRGLDAFVYSVYSGAKFILVGTPSGITLGPEGGAHQSLITPSIGVELPELAFYEPCFGLELEWIFLDAMEKIRLRQESTYMRLTSKRIDQGLFDPPSEPTALDKLRQQVLGGAYLLVDRSVEAEYLVGVNVVHLMACGAVVPEAIEASEVLLKEGVFANVVNVTGPGPLYRRFQKSTESAMANLHETEPFLSDVIPISDRNAPIVTVADGHPHSLAWIGGALKTSVFPLGVAEFGQSGNPSELYEEYGINSENIVAASFAVLET